MLPVQTGWKSVEKGRRDQGRIPCARCSKSNSSPLGLPCGRAVPLCRDCANDFRMFLDRRISEIEAELKVIDPSNGEDHQIQIKHADHFSARNQYAKITPETLAACADIANYSNFADAKERGKVPMLSRDSEQSLMGTERHSDDCGDSDDERQWVADGDARKVRSPTSVKPLPTKIVPQNANRRSQEMLCKDFLDKSTPRSTGIKIHSASTDGSNPGRGFQPRGPPKIHHGFTQAMKRLTSRSAKLMHWESPSEGEMLPSVDGLQAMHQMNGGRGNYSTEKNTGRCSPSVRPNPFPMEIARWKRAGFLDLGQQSDFSQIRNAYLMCPPSITKQTPRR